MTLFRISFKKLLLIILWTVFITTINTLFYIFYIWTHVSEVKFRTDFQTVKFLQHFNSSKMNLTGSVITSRKYSEKLEDFTMYSLLDPREQFETPVKKFGENAPKKVLLTYNMPGFEDIPGTNKKFETCEYNNCMMTNDKAYLKTADAILFTICSAGMGVKPPVEKRNRNPNQAWVFKCGETPIHHWYSDYKSSAWDNTMNWSISYRIDSDMPHPYGYLKTRKVPLTLDYESIYKLKTKTVLWIVSNCRAQSARAEYATELMKHGIDVDIYGRCGPKGRIDKDTLQKIIPQYKFYLGFENSLCNGYVTEKFFLYYQYNWIIVARGGANYDKLLPTKSYINTAHFGNVSLLAEYLLNLGNDQDKYINFLQRKDMYEQKYEYGHKYSICELCRRLNNVSKFRKTYTNMRDYLENGQCRMPTDVNNPRSSTRYQNHDRVFQSV